MNFQQPSDRFPTGLPTASRSLFDASSIALFKRAIFEVFGTTSPHRSQLHALGREASQLAGRTENWGGNHLYTLLHADRYKKYGINPDLLAAVCQIAGIDIKEEMQRGKQGVKTHPKSITRTGNQSTENTMPGAGGSAKNNQEGHLRLTNRRIKEDRGQGTGSEYSPWLHIQDVPSLGLSHRVYGHKTHREHHFLSNLELNYFYMTEWDPSVTDLREQYPLKPLEETIGIAETLGIRHPTNPKTKCPIVMTTDFRITLQRGLDKIEYARAIKCSSDLENNRVLEKLEIERQYWLKRKIDWAIATERDIPIIFVENIRLLREYLEINDRIVVPAEEIEEIEAALRAVVQEMPLSNGCAQCDRRFGFTGGTSLGLAYHFMATRRWQIDMMQPIKPNKKIAFTSNSEK
jgi:hypothetical protein